MRYRFRIKVDLSRLPFYIFTCRYSLDYVPSVPAEVSGVANEVQ
jgi:hypothetical protein